MPIRADKLKPGDIIDLMGLPTLSAQEQKWANDWYATVLAVVELGFGRVTIMFNTNTASPAFRPVTVVREYMFKLSGDLPMITSYKTDHKGEYDLEYDVDRATEHAYENGRMGLPSDQIRGRHNGQFPDLAMWEWELMHGYVASERYDKLWGGREVDKYSGFYGEGED